MLPVGIVWCRNCVITQKSLLFVRRRGKGILRVQLNVSAPSVQYKPGTWDLANQMAGGAPRKGQGLIPAVVAL